MVKELKDLEVLDVKDLELGEYQDYQQKAYDYFNNYINRLVDEGKVSAFSFLMARDIAWDMTLGWDVMEAEVVKRFAKYEDEFVKALGLADDKMLTENQEEMTGLEETQINDFLMDISQDYGFDMVYTEFDKLTKGE